MCTIFVRPINGDKTYDMPVISIDRYYGRLYCPTCWTGNSPHVCFRLVDRKLHFHAPVGALAWTVSSSYDLVL